MTSIPPVFSRRDATGREIGDQYLARCIESWRFCGFDPISVHSVNEKLHPILDAFDVKVVRVPRDAVALTGRPHVFLQDLLNVGMQQGGDRVFVINADIELEMDQAARRRLHGLVENGAFAAHRLDHAGDKAQGQRSYQGGIDLLGARRDLLKGLTCGTLVFGMPWWDHFLPLMLLARNAAFVSGQGVRPWHLDHGGRWNKAQHIAFGKEFLTLLRQSTPKHSRNGDFARYLKQVEDALRGHSDDSGFRRLKSRLLATLRPQSDAHYRYVLRETSRLDEAILGQITHDGVT